MAQADSTNTTDPAAPTTSDMDAMWLEAREAELAEADRRGYERYRRGVNRILYGHILDGEAA